MSGWGTGWTTEQVDKEYQELMQTGTTPEMLGIKQDEMQTVYDIPKFLNKKPTHDPYTNPNAHIYYECGCGAILDPGTKSFAQLNNCASQSGWKVRWGADSYVPYCVKCGEDVE